MSKPLFSVLVADVEREDQHPSWEIPTSWLKSALSDTDAEPTEKIGQLTASLMKNGRQFLIRGQISVQVVLPCARTLDPATYDLKPDLFLVLSRESAPKPGQRNRPRAPQKDNDDGDLLLDEQDAAYDTFSGDVIALDDFVREQIVLELPMFPLRSDLRSKPAEAIPSPPASTPSEPEIDPRLAPLQALAEKLKNGKK